VIYRLKTTELSLASYATKTNLKFATSVQSLSQKKIGNSSEAILLWYSDIYTYFTDHFLFLFQLDFYRCFWLHLAIALGVNPFLLCCFFRIQHERRSIQPCCREMGSIDNDACIQTLDSFGMQTDSAVLEYIIPPTEFHKVEVTIDWI
jgi:hypothetical protein